MTRLLKLYAVVVSLLFSSNGALASPLGWTLTMDGNFGANLSEGFHSPTINLLNGAILALGGTVRLASQSSDDPVIPTSDLPSSASPSTGSAQIFQSFEDVATDTFYVTSAQTEPNGSFVSYGSLVGGNPADAARSHVSLTPNDAADNPMSGALQVTAAPEPSSLLLLGTGLTCAAGLLFHHRKKVG